MLRLALLGCGGIARLAHAPSLARMRDVEVVAIADTDTSRRDAMRALVPRARAFADYRDALDAPGVDAAIVALPTAMHAEAAVAALERGKHLYLEKPLATTVAEGRRVLDAWAGSSLVAMMGFNYRRNPLVERARDMLRSGVVGPPLAARTVFSTSAREEPVWKGARTTGGGVLLDLGVHHFDLIRFLFGEEITGVEAELRALRAEDDTAFVRLRLAGGCVAQCFFSSGTVEEDRIEVYGPQGKLTVDRYGSLRVGVTPVAAGGALGLSVKRALAEWSALPYAIRKLRAPGHEPSYATALEAFARAVRAGGPVEPDLGDGLRALEVVAAAEASRRSAAPVLLGSAGQAEGAPRRQAHAGGL